MVRSRPEPRQLPARATQIIAAARELLEGEGRDALTMRRLAQVLGIRAPSIYKHLPGKQAVEVALMEAGFAELGEALHTVVAQSQANRADDGIAALMTAYRAECLARPNLYRLATTGQLPREELTPGLEEWAGEPWFLVAGDSFLAQAMWSFAHGMVILELDRRYPESSDLDQTWRAGAEAFTLAVKEKSQTAPAAQTASKGRENG